MFSQSCASLGDSRRKGKPPQNFDPSTAALQPQFASSKKPRPGRDARQKAAKSAAKAIAAEKVAVQSNPQPGSVAGIMQNYGANAGVVTPVKRKAAATPQTSPESAVGSSPEGDTDAFLLLPTAYEVVEQQVVASLEAARNGQPATKKKAKAGAVLSRAVLARQQKADKLLRHYTGFLKYIYDARCELQQGRPAREELDEDIAQKTVDSSDPRIRLLRVLPSGANEIAPGTEIRELTRSSWFELFEFWVTRDKKQLANKGSSRKTEYNLVLALYRKHLRCLPGRQEDAEFGTLRVFRPEIHAQLAQ